MFLVRLVFLPVRVGTKATKVAAKTGYRTGRMLGYKRLFVFGAGVAVGVLFAPGPGRELREKLKALVEGATPSYPAYAEQPHYETTTSLSAVERPQPATVSGTNGHN